MKISKEHKSAVVKFFKKTYEWVDNPTSPVISNVEALPEILQEEKIKVPFIDDQFAHANMDESTHFIWDRDHKKYNYAFVTDTHVADVLTLNKDTYAWLVESPEITPQFYNFVAQNHAKFKGVMTFKKSLLDISSEKFHFVPGGRCWIKPEDMQIWPKKKLISIIASNKNTTSGHHLRIRTIQRLRNKMDVFGRGWNEIPDKIDGLKDYMFSVAIENTSEDYYFTEKLLDCFMTGTIPIYYGCPSIGKFFNLGGILQANSLQDIESIVANLTEESYKKRLDAVKENFERCKNLLYYEDYMYGKYKHLLLNKPAASPLNEFVDKTYCINLERRLDRKEKSLSLFKKHGIDATMWPAVDGQKLTGRHPMNNFDPNNKGAVGCLRSHRAVLQDAIANRYERICIFEDDLEIQDDFNKKLKSLIDNLPADWDMAYLGCHFHGLKEPNQRIAGNVFKMHRAFGIYGVIMKNTVFKKILEVSKEEKIPMDNYITQVQPTINAYCAIPFLVKVIPDFSDIANKFEEYKITGKFYF